VSRRYLSLISEVRWSMVGVAVHYHLGNVGVHPQDSVPLVGCRQTQKLFKLQSDVCY